MPKLIAANWKENPASELAALKLFWEVTKVVQDRERGNSNVVICPPFIYLQKIAEAYRSMQSKRGFAIGVQDIFWEEKGAFTGGIGPKMIRSLGATYAIIGHSERRKYLQETDTMINKKIKLAVKDKLNVILCVGEPLAVRKKGITAAESFVNNQLKKDLAGVRGKITIAYEPIWAIGTGKNDSPEDAWQMARFIKKSVTGIGMRGAKVLYGGSVNGKNIRDYVQYKDVDGALVGGASLKAGEFKKIIQNT